MVEKIKKVLIKVFKVVLKILVFLSSMLMFNLYDDYYDEVFLVLGIILLGIFVISFIPKTKFKRKNKDTKKNKKKLKPTRKKGGYQIFVSYRRDTGGFLAGRIVDRLRMKGYRVFFDIESMSSGVFNEQIFKAIDECEDFILVLQQGSLDRCVNDDDWVRKEIEYAFKQNKNIIPIWTSDFAFPENVPDSISGLRQIEGVALSTDYFDAFVERVDNFINCKSK